MLDFVRLKALLDAMPVGVVAMDPSSKVIFYNRFEEQLAGRSRENVLGKPFFKEVAPCIQVSGLDTHFANEFGGALNCDIQFRFPRPCVDKPRDVRLRLSTLEVEGERIGILIVEDVSMVRAVERTKDFLVRALAHDMSNPLTSIGTGLELAGSARDADERKRIHEQAFAALGRLQNMVQNLFDITRLHTGETPLQAVESQIDEILRDVAESHRTIAARRNVSIDIEESSGPAVAEVDAELVRRALDNLVENAIRFTDPGGQIRLSAAMSGDGVAIRVRDNGAGIADELKERIFEPYVSTGHGIAEGRPHFGLGLAFVDLVAREHGGTIVADCPESGGSVFTLSLPSTPPRRAPG